MACQVFIVHQWRALPELELGRPRIRPQTTRRWSLLESSRAHPMPLEFGPSSPNLHPSSPFTKSSSLTHTAMAGVAGASSSPIKVAALCGSLRNASYHRGLIRSAIELSKDAIEGIDIEYIDISSLPMLNTDLEDNGTYPPEVEAFRRKILAADSILFASPEYNYSLAAPLKNAIDWASRPPNVFARKAAAIVSTGGNAGGLRSQYHLRQVGVYLDLHFINKPEFSLRAFEPPPKFNSHGDLIDEEAKNQLKQLLLSLQAFTLTLQTKC